jgi:hypothetical protein
MQDYVRNELKKNVQKQTSVAVIRITRVDLNNTLAKLTGNKVSYQLFYNSQEQKPKPSSFNNNSDIFALRLTDSREALIKVHVKGFLFGNKEVGHSFLQLDQVDCKNLKCPILHENTTVGFLTLNLSISTEALSMSTQSTCNSLDMREDFGKDASNLDLDLFKSMNLASQPTEGEESVLFVDKHERGMMEFIEKVKGKREKILAQRQELELASRELEKRAEEMQRKRMELGVEAEIVKEEKRKVREMKE